MSKRRPSLRQPAPVPPPAKAVSPPAPQRLSHARRLEAEKQSLLGLEQSLKLQSYTIRLPRAHPLFSGNDTRRPVFPSVPSQVIRLHSGK